MMASSKAISSYRRYGKCGIARRTKSVESNLAHSHGGDGVYRHDILSASKMIKMIMISETCMHKHMHIRHQAACMYSTRSAPKSKSAKMILRVSTLETSAS